MTAEEIAHKAIGNLPYKNILKKQIKDYAKQKCKEQRNLCAENARTNLDVVKVWAEINKESIQHAPEPDME